MKTCHIRTMISQSNWFKGLTEDVYDKLAASAKLESYDKNDFICHTGDISDHITYIVSGRIRISLLSPLGQQFALNDFEAGTWIGEPCLFSNDTQLLEVQFKEPGETLNIKNNVLHEIAREHPAIYFNILKEYTERSQNVYKVLRGMLFYPLKSRLAGRISYLLNKHGVSDNGGMYINIQLSQQDFANLVHGSRQRINKIFKKWNNEGIVITKNHRYFIPSVERLKQEIHLVES